jgi:release factor glutamine methyltransferase
MNQTITALYRQLRRQLEPVTQSAEQASFEAGWFMRETLGMTAEQLHSQGDTQVSPSEGERLQDLLALRVEKRIPIQYLFHEAWFFGLSFYVNPHVLIPRPETELLVERVLAIAKPGMRILDVGTGPGTIALALAHKLADTCSVTATDISVEALQVARLNQKRHHTSVDFRASGDLFASLSADERFDVIVSNPPYVNPALKQDLLPEVSWHEPSLALFPPGDDYYCFYRRLAKEGKRHLQHNGSLLMEIGAGMGESTRNIMLAEGCQDVEIINDYAGLERIVKATWVNPAISD